MTSHEARGEARHEAHGEARDEARHEAPAVFSAPGKAFLLGEYAVLEGAPALVTAVSCRARGCFVPGAVPSSRLIEETMRAVVSGLPAGSRSLPTGAVVVDTTAFLDKEGRKLGLGSSAAAAAVAVAALRATLAAPAEAPPSVYDDERLALFRLAHGAHRASQGGVGSGADVAAAVYGGLVEFAPAVAAPADAASADVVIRRLPWPAGLEPLWFSAPQSASTPAFVAAVKAWAAAAPARYRAHLRTLRDHAEAGAAAFAAGARADVLGHVAAYGLGLSALGHDAHVPIVIPAFAEAARLAADLGGAAKPSGAGGGDIGVALFTDAANRQGFADRLPKLGLTPLELGLDLAGTSREPRASHERTNV